MEEERKGDGLDKGTWEGEEDEEEEEVEAEGEGEGERTDMVDRSFLRIFEHLRGEDGAGSGAGGITTRDAGGCGRFFSFSRCGVIAFFDVDGGFEAPEAEFKRRRL